MGYIIFGRLQVTPYWWFTVEVKYLKQLKHIICISTLRGFLTYV